MGFWFDFTLFEFVVHSICGCVNCQIVTSYIFNDNGREKWVDFGDHFIYIRNVINFDTVHFLDNDFSSLFAAVCYAPFNSNQTHTRFYILGFSDPSQPTIFTSITHTVSSWAQIFDIILQTFFDVRPKTRPMLIEWMSGRQILNTTFKWERERKKKMF